MCFYCILKGQFCIGEGTKTWGDGREQAILSGQFLGYLCLLVFSEKRNRLTCWFFRIFCWTTVVLYNIEITRPTWCHTRRTSCRRPAIVQSPSGRRTIYVIICVQPFVKNRLFNIESLRILNNASESERENEHQRSCNHDLLRVGQRAFARKRCWYKLARNSLLCRQLAISLDEDDSINFVVVKVLSSL